MEGACVYINNKNYPEIAMYKELLNYDVLLCIYSNCTVRVGYITTKTLTDILPISAIHILTYMPLSSNHSETIKIWRTLVLDRLNRLNRFNRFNNFVAI